MRTLILLLVLMAAVVTTQADRLQERGYVSFFKHISVTTSEDKDGNFTAKSPEANITVIKPVTSSTLASGANIRIVTTVTTFTPPQAFEQSFAVKMVMRAIYNCEKLETFISTMIILDKDDQVLFKDMNVDSLAAIDEGSSIDEVRKHVCKLPNKPSGLSI